MSPYGAAACMLFLQTCDCSLLLSLYVFDASLPMKSQADTTYAHCRVGGDVSIAEDDTGTGSATCFVEQHGSLGAEREPDLAPGKWGVQEAASSVLCSTQQDACGFS